MLMDFSAWFEASLLASFNGSVDKSGVDFLESRVNAALPDRSPLYRDLLPPPNGGDAARTISGDKASEDIGKPGIRLAKISWD